MPTQRGEKKKESLALRGTYLRGEEGRVWPVRVHGSDKTAVVMRQKTTPENWHANLVAQYDIGRVSFAFSVPHTFSGRVIKESLREEAERFIFMEFIKTSY